MYWKFEWKVCKTLDLNLFWRVLKKECQTVILSNQRAIERWAKENNKLAFWLILGTIYRDNKGIVHCCLEWLSLWIRTTWVSMLSVFSVVHFLFLDFQMDHTETVTVSETTHTQSHSGIHTALVVRQFIHNLHLVIPRVRSFYLSLCLLSAMLKPMRHCLVINGLSIFDTESIQLSQIGEFEEIWHYGG